MNTPNTLLPSDAVMLKDNRAITTSRMVAAVFGQRHSAVLHKIRTLYCSATFHQANFTLAEYVDRNGRAQPLVEMTNDGFALVVPSATGRQATRVRPTRLMAAYLTAFAAVDTHVRRAPASRRRLRRRGLRPAA